MASTPNNIQITPHQARYFALDLRCRSHAGDVSTVAPALFDARVDLHPHQIEAALFAVQATKEEGRILADEVGLGKTIEAALVLSQLWAERRRRLLVIAPASLRRQWASEIEDKFGIAVRVVDGAESAAGLEGRVILVCSYHYAARRAAWLVSQSWDLVVLDEAHRLRNVRRSRTGMNRTIVDALRDAPKVLLTATPMQNSLLELYGIVSAVSERLLGDEVAFRHEYVNRRSGLDELRARISPVIHRTLRRDVLPYVQFTARRPLTWRFRSSEEEQELQDAVTSFVEQDDLRSIPSRTRGLLRMLLHKLLASSPAAIAGALAAISKRLRKTISDPIEADWKLEELEDEGLDPGWFESDDSGSNDADGAPEASALDGGQEDLGEADLKAELLQIDAIIASANRIEVDQRALALLSALAAGFEQMRARGASQKAVVFTESRRTQERLRAFLEGHGYRGEVVCFSGSNSDPNSSAILEAWSQRHPTLASTSSRAVNLRAALIDHFQHHAAILIATEAGAEGLNLQFCSLVVNYDLPWNPQRIEQRIGRCHRYGQQHDVVVVNFIDEASPADRRVLELLTEKIGLFEGVLGASDAVLGAIEGGLDLERKLHLIFRTCRSNEEIEAAFAALRVEMDEVIRAREAKAQKALFEHFDDTVHDRLKIQLDRARSRLDRMGRQFWCVTRWALEGLAAFDADTQSFDLRQQLAGVDASTGRYELVSKEGTDSTDAIVYRLSHPLGEYVLRRAIETPLESRVVVFEPSRHPLKVSAVDGLRGGSGWLSVERVRVEGMGSEEHLLLSGFRSDGIELDAEVLDRMMSIWASSGEHAEPTSAELARLEAGAQRVRERCIAESAARNHRDFQEQLERLRRWAASQVKGAELELADIRGQIAELEKKSVLAPLEEQEELQSRIAALEKRKKEARLKVFRAEDETSAMRDALIGDLKRRMAQRTTVERVFSVPWRVG